MSRGFLASQATAALQVMTCPLVAFNSFKTSGEMFLDIFEMVTICGFVKKWEKQFQKLCLALPATPGLLLATDKIFVII